MSRYEPFGPFEIPTKGRLIDRFESAQFWEEVRRRSFGLPGAVGCYVFAIRAGKGAKPWYVGKTEKGNFKGETWSPHKLNIYNEALSGRKRCTPLLYLIAKRTSSGRYAKPRKRGIGEIRALENLLIGVCLLRNRELLNVKQTKYPKGIVVPGYMNANRGARSAPAKDLAKLLRRR
jgi:hypothetical protein